MLLFLKVGKITHKPVFASINIIFLYLFIKQCDDYVLPHVLLNKGLPLEAPLFTSIAGVAGTFINNLNLPVATWLDAGCTCVAKENE
jgi:hypothetical protein